MIARCQPAWAWHASTFYLYPLRRTWWEAKVQNLPRARKRLRERRGLVPCALEPRKLCQAGAGVAGHMSLLPIQAEPRRAAWCWSVSSKHVVRGVLAGLPPPQRMFPWGNCLRGSRGWGGGGDYPYPVSLAGFPSAFWCVRQHVQEALPNE